jgi:hypothetical protein
MQSILRRLGGIAEHLHSRRWSDLYMLQTIKSGRPDRQSAAPLKSCSGRAAMSSGLRTSRPAKFTIPLVPSEPAPIRTSRSFS